MWVHHGWVVTPEGTVIDRTWKHPGKRYIGVTFDLNDSPRDPGMCQLADYGFEMAWAPDLVGRPEEADMLFGARQS